MGTDVVDKPFSFGPGNKNATADIELQTSKPSPSQHILYRFALLQALHGSLNPLLVGIRQSLDTTADDVGKREAELLLNEHTGNSPRLALVVHTGKPAPNVVVCHKYCIFRSVLLYSNVYKSM